MPLKKIFKNIFSLDTRSIALFRVCLGLLILLDLFNRSFDLVAFYTDEGVMPREFLLHSILGPPDNSFHLYSGSAIGQVILFLVAAGFAICLILGIHARIAAFFSWILVVSLHNRNPMVLQSGDVLLRNLLFWAMFLPLASSSPTPVKKAKKEQSYSFYSLAAVGVTLQLVYIYVFSGILKLTNPIWQSGRALINIMNDHRLTTFVAEYLLKVPFLLRGINHGTLLMEIGVPVLVFVPYFREKIRLALVVLFVGFHAALSTTLKVGLFPLISITGWVVLLPASFWETPPGRLFFGPLVERCSRYAVVGEFTPSKFRDRFIGLIQISTIFYVFFWCLSTVPGAPDLISTYNLRAPGYFFGLSQSWSMFSIPNTADGFFVIPGTLVNGSEVDLFREGAPVNWERPADVSSEFRGDRWRKYMLNLLSDSNAPNLLQYGRYLCRSWNAEHKGTETLETFQLIYKRRFFEWPEGDYRKAVLWSHECFDGAGARFPYKYHSDP